MMRIEKIITLSFLLLTLNSYGMQKTKILSEADKMLFKAVGKGDLKAIKSALDSGADVNAENNNNITSLSWAIREGRLDIVKELIKHGADVNAKDSRNATPLHWAVWFGKLDIVKELLEHGADVNAKDRNDGTPLNLAVREGHLEVVKELIENGADINEKSVGLVKNYFKDEPLLLAAALGDIAELKELIGLRPNSEDLTQALIYASAQKQKDAVLLLSQAGANALPAITRLKIILSRPFLTPEDRSTYKQILNQLVISLPLSQQILIRPGLQPVLAAGAYTLPEEVRENLIPSTQLIAAVKNGDVKRLKELLEKGINPNDVKDENGNSLLAIAVKHDDVTTVGEMVQLLLDHQAYPNPASVQGKSLLQVLCSSGDTSRRNIAEMLLAAVHNRGIGIPIDLDHQCKQFITKTAASGIESLTSITNK
ncbi:MAG TPA: ankyrin repeat domain-containing protein [Candidatus Babeliaceae bacterium]|nr:ankyrin repeat domain-containing protein [Candidatus Babeliaceae bacterium]